MKNDIKNLLIYILTFFVLSAIGMMNTNAAAFRRMPVIIHCLSCVISSESIPDAGAAGA